MSDVQAVGARPLWAEDERIASIDVRTVALPLDAPVRNGTRTIISREYAVLRVATGSGAAGIACAFTRATPLVDVIRDHLGPQLIGRTPFEIQAVWNDLYRSGETFFGRSGVFPRALSLVDIALWDLHGRLLGRSVADLLGGARASIPIMMALGYYRAENEFELLRQEYATLAGQGFRRFKMMAGGTSLERDLQRVAEISDVLPSDATLAVDVNGAWSTAAEAHALLDGIERDIAFIEDPFTPDNETALREFRRSSDIPVAIGEWESGRARFGYLIENELADILRIDATAAGGISEWLAIAAIAEQHGTRILPHYFPEIHVHLAAVTPGAEAIEAVPRITGADNFDELAVVRPWVEAPATAVASRPGLGIGWDARLISQLSGRAWGDASEGVAT